MALSDLLLHSEVAGFVATEGVRQLTFPETVALRGELQGKSVWLRDDERPTPGTYIISDEKGELEAFESAKKREREEVDLSRVVEIMEYGSQEALAVDIDILDIRLGRIVVYAKKGLARVAGERRIDPDTPESPYSYQPPNRHWMEPSASPKRTHLGIARGLSVLPRTICLAAWTLPLYVHRRRQGG